MDWSLLIKISLGTTLLAILISLGQCIPQSRQYGFEPKKITEENRYQSVEYNEADDLQYSDESPNYEFQYEIHGGGNLFGHAETRKEYQTNGRYHVLLPDGRRQIVTYYADESGYHPTVTYEVVGNNNLDYSQNSRKSTPSYLRKREADGEVPDLPVIKGQQQDYIATLRPTYTGAIQRLEAAYGQQT